MLQTQYSVQVVHMLCMACISDVCTLSESINTREIAASLCADVAIISRV